MELTQKQLEELACSQTLELSNGAILKLTIGTDDDTTINDFDCYGRTEWTKNNPYSGNSTRPEAFDGNAEKLLTDRGSTLWWQPYLPTKADRRQWHTNKDVRQAWTQTVRDIVQFGFLFYRLELCHGTDVYGQPIVIGYTVMGGIEPLSDVDTGTLSDMLAMLSNCEVAA